jgi:hypothetical protein
MIRNVLIVLVVIAAVGFAPAVAQDYFIKKDKESGTGKPILYNKLPAKPKSSLGRGGYKVQYKDKLEVKRQKITSLKMAKSLDEIYELGLKPRNAEELIFYAQASRAVTQNMVYKRREALMEHLEKQEQQLDAQIASMQAGDFEADKGSRVKKKNVRVKKAIKTGGPYKKENEEQNRPQLFVKSKQDGDKPRSKVFTGYR